MNELRNRVAWKNIWIHQKIVASGSYFKNSFLMSNFNMTLSHSINPYFNEFIELHPITFSTILFGTWWICHTSFRNVSKQCLRREWEQILWKSINWWKYISSRHRKIIYRNSFKQIWFRTRIYIYIYISWATVKNDILCVFA